MPVIIKLGGSIVTRKHSGKPVLRLGIVRRLAQELLRLRQSGRLGQCILLHGAGSFGHPLVFRHKLDGRRLSGRTISLVSRTIQSVENLTTCITKELLRAGLPVVPLQTTGLVTGSKNQWKFLGKKPLSQILRSGGIPLLSGQLVVSDDGCSRVLSADRLAMILAKLFSTTRIIFCTDTDGVYAHFPPDADELPIEHMNRPEFSKFIRSQITQQQPTDVTGAMVGKLRAIANSYGGTVVITNGLKAGCLISALNPKPHGTIIRMRAKKKPSRRVVRVRKD